MASAKTKFRNWGLHHTQRELEEVGSTAVAVILGSHPLDDDIDIKQELQQRAHSGLGVELDPYSYRVGEYTLRVNDAKNSFVVVKGIFATEEHAPLLRQTLTAIPKLSEAAHAVTRGYSILSTERVVGATPPKYPQVFLAAVAASLENWSDLVSLDITGIRRSIDLFKLTPPASFMGGYAEKNTKSVVQLLLDGTVISKGISIPSPIIKITRTEQSKYRLYSEKSNASAVQLFIGPAMVLLHRYIRPLDTKVCVSITSVTVV